MIDMEKVTYGLRCMCYGDVECKECPYARNGSGWHDCRSNCAKDALELLKEQEAVEPKTGHWIYKKYDDMFMCSCCEKYSIRNDYPYCHWCGAKMEGM